MDQKPEKIIVGIADLAVVHNPAILVTIGLGSCVASRFAIQQPNSGDCPIYFFQASMNQLIRIIL